MNILVLNDFVVFPGGGTSIAHFSALGLHQRGHNITFIAGNGATTEMQAPYPIESLGLLDVRGRSRLSALFNGIYSLAARRGLRRLLRRFPPAKTLVILHQWTRVLSPAVFDVLRRYRTLVYAHDFFLTCPTGAMYRFDTGRPCTLKPLSLECISANCDRETRWHKAVRVLRTALQNSLIALMRDLEVVFVSQGQQRRYGSLFPTGRNQHVLANIPAMPPSGTVFFGEDEPGRTVLYIGRLVPEKGALDLAVAGRASGVRCTFAGAGPLLQRLRDEFPEHDAPGWLKADDLGVLINAARAVAMPSRWPETSGLAALEALQAGIPVLVSDAMCAADDLRTRGGCRIYDAESAEALAESLRLVGSTEWAQVMAEARSIARQTRYAEVRDDYFDRLQDIIAQPYGPVPNVREKTPQTKAG